MIKKIQKYKPFLVDLFINTFSFAIYIIAQQLLFMPLMGKWLNEVDFANFVIYISIFSILTNALGNELGITNQIESANDDEKYIKLLAILSGIIFIISFISNLLIHYNFINALILSIVMVIANIRLYASGYFRKKREFKHVFFQNIFYLIGMIIGLITFKRFNIIFLPSLIAEIFSISYTLYKYNILTKINFKTKITKKITRKFSSFSFISFLGNTLVYFDKILIYPILGTNAVNVYYSTTAMSKIINMIVNPIHGVLLSWINKGTNKQNKKIIINAIKISFIISIISIVISIPLTYFAVKLLYNQFLKDAMIIIPPVSIGVGFNVGASIIKSFVMKFLSNKKLICIHLIYFIFFIIISIAFSKHFHILGFAIAGLISKLILYLEFVICLYHNTKRGKHNEE